MEWFIAVVVVAALGVAAIVAAGGLGSMAAEPIKDTFRQDLPTDRLLTGEDLGRLRFGVNLRGYAMDQVDDLLDRLSAEVAERDARIAELEVSVADQPPLTVADPADGYRR
ncbi:MAG: DivIVA domain-containing protein [Microlunatus sp.]|nr:DivIVA domain-containing protein [Microlunatus sp.]